MYYASQTNKEFSEQFKIRIYKLILAAIKFLESLPNNDPVCRVIKDQGIRSITSIGANYVEAIAGVSKNDFSNFLSHALKSANESKFWFALLRDTGKINKEKVAPLLDELCQISNILGASIGTMKKKRGQE